MKKDLYFYLYISAVSLYMPYFVAVDSYEFYAAKYNFLAYLTSASFLIKFLPAVAAAAAALLLTLRVIKAGASQGRDKKFFIATALLCLAGVTLSFQVHRYQYLICISGLIGASVIALYFLRVKTGFEEGSNAKKMPGLVAGSLVVVITGIAAASSFSFFNNFFMKSDSMGIFTNAIWRTAYDGSQFTLAELARDHRGVHFQPVMYLLSILFKVGCMPRALLLLQVAAVFSGALFLYGLAKELLKDRVQAFLVCAAFCVSPYVFRTFVFDFHPETFYILFLTAFLYFSEKRMFMASVAALVLAASVKEEAAVYAALAAVFVFTRTEDKRYIAAAACSAVYAFIVMALVIPAFNPDNAWFIGNMVSYFAGGKYDFLSEDAFGQLFVFFAGLAFLPALRFKPFFLLVLPPALVHFLSFKPTLYLFDMYYSSFTAPAAFAAVLYTLKEIKDGRGRMSGYTGIITAYIFMAQSFIHFGFIPVSKALSTAVTCAALLFLIPVFSAKKKPGPVFFTSVALTCVFIFYSGYYSYFRYRELMLSEEQKKSIRAAIKMVPSNCDTPVLSNDILMPYFSCRKFAWIVEQGTITGVFRPVIQYRFKEFYFVVTYRPQVPPGEDTQNEWNKRIFDLSMKLGYKGQMMYKDDVSLVARFFK
jgi:uncharacterized membrane protein